MINKIARSILAIAACSLVVSCSCLSGQFSYTPPPSAHFSRSLYERTYPYPLEQMWDASIDYIADSFFVIDHVIKDSKIINLSFGVDRPEKYLDCGTTESWVSGIFEKKRLYSFPTSSKYPRYEVNKDGSLVCVERTVILNGKINIFFTEVSENKTKVRVKTRYILQYTAKDYLDCKQLLTSDTITVSANTGEISTYRDITVCQPTHLLESGLLNGIEKKIRKTQGGMVSLIE